MLSLIKEVDSNKKKILLSFINILLQHVVSFCVLTEQLCLMLQGIRTGQNSGKFASFVFATWVRCAISICTLNKTPFNLKISL